MTCLKRKEESAITLHSRSFFQEVSNRGTRGIRTFHLTLKATPQGTRYAPTLLLPMINTFRFIVVPAAAAPFADPLCCCCVFVAGLAAAELAPRAWLGREDMVVRGWM
jgi:hypothetical protein